MLRVAGRLVLVMLVAACHQVKLMGLVLGLMHQTVMMINWVRELLLLLLMVLLVMMVVLRPEACVITKRLSLIGGHIGGHHETRELVKLRILI